MIPAQLNVLAVSFAKTRPFFQAGLALLSVGFLLSIVKPVFNFFVLTGAQLVRFEVWRLVTHFMFEKNPLILAFAVYALFRASTMFEPLWGSLEVGKFFAITQFTSSIALSVVSLLYYAITKDDRFFFDSRIFGVAAASVAVLVAVKQYLPDSILLTTPVCRFKNTHLPGIAVFFASVAVLLGVLRWIVILQILFGIQISWIYLRFYQVHEDNEPRGDASDHFAWATLFPSKLQPLMNVIGSTIFTILVKLRICRPVTRHIDISQMDSINILLPTSQTKEAERKRQKAIRDLTERLSRSQRDDTGNWPEMEDANDAVVDVKQPEASATQGSGGVSSAGDSALVKIEEEAQKDAEII